VSPPSAAGPPARRLALRIRIGAALGLAALAALGLHAALTRWPLPQLLAWLQPGDAPALAAPAPDGAAGVLLTLAVLLPLAAWAAGRLLRPLERLLRALEGLVLSYHDGDFSLSIAADGADELGELVRVHNALGKALREQRQHLVERELLLDTLVQNTPVAMLLTDAAGRVAYANLAARQLLGRGRRLEGAAFPALLAEAPAALREAVEAGVDSVFSVALEGIDESFHFSRRRLRLQGRPHELQLLRRMTRELSRQEVATWKRVIRVMSHELYNSLAPISSLAHSGAELARRGSVERLPGVFATIGERARHLHEFLDGYASVAKLPAPRPTLVAWPGFVEGLAAHSRLRLDGALPATPGFFDAGQVEQALINLLKNAAEAGGPPEAVTLNVAQVGHEHRVAVCDRGPGMTDTVLGQALLPFYSTKRSGSGLGLALAREIVEAHGGRIALANREGGGLCVSLFLPLEQRGDAPAAPASPGPSSGAPLPPQRSGTDENAG
jgi:nitrogen fixation/metabolism regulation signal transduction histidine kinase